MNLHEALDDEAKRYETAMQQGVGIDWYRKMSDEHWLRLEAIFRRFNKPMPTLDNNQLFGQEEPSKPSGTLPSE